MQRRKRRRRASERLARLEQSEHARRQLRLHVVPHEAPAWAPPNGHTGDEATRTFMLEIQAALLAYQAGDYDGDALVGAIEDAIHDLEHGREAS